MGSFIKIIRIFTSLYLTLTAHLAQIWCIEASCNSVAIADHPNTNLSEDVVWSL